MSGVTAVDEPIDRPADGRALRAARSRQVVVETFLDLVGEGQSQPTAQQVSDRSGVSMRSIFRLFDDVDAMHSAAVATQIDRVVPLLVHIDSTGSLDRRVRALMDNRSSVFEAISPVRRLAVRLASSSRPIQGDLALANDFFRNQTTEVFTQELAPMPPARRRDTVDLLDALTSWETWERLRSAQGLPAERARRILVASIKSTLAC